MLASARVIQKTAPLLESTKSAVAGQFKKIVF